MTGQGVGRDLPADARAGSAGLPRVRRSYRTVGGAQVHLRSCGGTGRPVLLLHHAPSSSATWDPLLPHLAAEGLAAVAVDLPGYGGSDGPATPPDLDWYADRVAALLTGEPVVRPWVVVGRQTGAAVAAALAVRHPHLVGGLVLWGYPLFEADLMTRLATEVTGPLDPDLSPPRAFLADLRHHDPLACDDDYDRAALAEYLGAGRHQHWAHNALGRSDPEALLRRVGQPTVLVYDLLRTDLPAQLTAARAAAAVVPGAPLVDLPGVSSSLAPTAVRPFAALVAGFAADPATFDAAAFDVATFDASALDPALRPTTRGSAAFDADGENDRP
jgi:pimeloyl-ACP methyl ester carboxylesterase